MLSDEWEHTALAVVNLLGFFQHLFGAFLLYTADLTGLWRALAVIGLGLVLIGIGYMYQRLLFVKKPPPRSPGG